MCVRVQYACLPLLTAVLNFLGVLFQNIFCLLVIWVTFLVMQPSLPPPKKKKFSCFHRT